jgi:hypothetical protein
MIQRLVYLGQEVTATAFFLDNNKNALQPKNPSIYPLCKIIDPFDDLVSCNVGSFDDKTQGYTSAFTIPEFASLSTDDHPYHVEWELLDSFNKSWFYREAFEVVHPSFDLTSAKEQQKLCLPFTSLQLSIPLPKKVSNVKLEIYDSNNSLIYSNGAPQQLGTYNEYYVYSISIPPSTLQAQKDYLAVWLITDGDVYSFCQVIHCSSLTEMSWISNLRMYLDKVQKSVDIYQGYKDSELYFYIQMGCDYINSAGKIPTAWTLSQWASLPMIANSQYWLLEAAKWVGLRAQYLAEGDSAFSFSSQPVTLDVDRTGFIESELGRIKDGLDNQMAAWKEATIKNTAPVGHLNVSFPNLTNRWLLFDLRAVGIPLRLFPSFRV